MKIIDLNVEGDRHFDKFMSFLSAEQAEVICLQEFPLNKVSEFANKLNYKYFHFFPYGKNYDHDEYVQGMAIYSKYKFENADTRVLYEMIPGRDWSYSHMSRIFGLIGLDLLINGKNISIYTTHLPATKEGSVDELQTLVVDKLIEIVKDKKNFILTGDFNAPRGRGSFDRIANVLVDNIPKEILTTIDGNIHKAGNLEYVVDGFFTSSDIKVKNIRLQDGLSDHMGIIAEIYV